MNSHFHLTRGVSCRWTMRPSNSNLVYIAFYENAFLNFRPLVGLEPTKTRLQIEALANSGHSGIVIIIVNSFQLPPGSTSGGNSFMALGTTMFTRPTAATGFFLCCPFKVIHRWPGGLEPSTSIFTVSRAIQLHYDHRASCGNRTHLDLLGR